MLPERYAYISALCDQLAASHRSDIKQKVPIIPGCILLAASMLLSYCKVILYLRLIKSINQSINQCKKNSIGNTCSYPPRRPHALCSEEVYTRSETKGKWNTQRVEHTDRKEREILIAFLVAARWHLLYLCLLCYIKYPRPE